MRSGHREMQWEPGYPPGVQQAKAQLQALPRLKGLRGRGSSGPRANGNSSPNLRRKLLTSSSAIQLATGVGGDATGVFGGTAQYLDNINNYYLLCTIL